MRIHTSLCKAALSNSKTRTRSGRVERAHVEFAANAIRLAVEPLVPPALAHGEQVDLNHVQHRGELREDEHARALGMQALEQTIEKVQFG